jgi:hypothetical protein
VLTIENDMVIEVWAIGDEFGAADAAGGAGKPVAAGCRTW